MIPTDNNPNINRKRSKKRKSRSSKSSSNPHSKRRNGERVRKKGKSKKRKKPKLKKLGPRPRKNSPFGIKQTQNNNDTKSSKDLPIITEEDHEDGSFSDSYIPTRFDASGFFSYHTWGKENIRPPDEDRVVRSGPSIWHWSWDLSFGLYDDIYDNYVSKKQHSEEDRKNNRSGSRDYELFLEETWLNLEGPIPSWQPLFAAIIWFIISMNILFPVSIIGQATPCPDDYYDNKKYNELSSNWHAIERTIHITSSYAHLQVGIILFSFEISAWITTPISSFLILRFGPSWMLFIGILLMIISSICMSFTWNFYNIQFVLITICFRMISGIGFNIVRQSSLFIWSCFAKLDMLSSGLGFCVGPVFGDLLYTYTGFPIAYIVYAVILFILLIILSIVIIFKLLTMEQISRLEIPTNIKNIRKPRYDLFHNKKITQIKSIKYYSNLIYIFFKFEILIITIIGLTALEPTLPIYSLDPDLDITVSGALFTFIYLPLLALSSLIGLIFAKSSSKFLNSPKKHVKKQRRGMKYITKTLSINFSGMNAMNTMNNNNQHPIGLNTMNNTMNNNNNNNKRFNVSKSEKIKLVERPSWLAKKKKLLPSPDISQHHIILLIGLGVTSLGYIILSGGNYAKFVTNSNGVDLVLGLVLISIGSAFIIISCIDSFINGLLLNINQTELTYITINISILIGPLLGGLMLDFANNDVPVLSQYWSYCIFIHFVIYLIFLICKYIYKCIQHCIFKKVKENKLKKHQENLLNSRKKLQKEKIINSKTDNFTTSNIVNSASFEYFNKSPLASTSPAKSTGFDDKDTNKSLSDPLIKKEEDEEEQKTDINPHSLPLIRDLSIGKIQPTIHRDNNYNNNALLIDIDGNKAQKLRNPLKAMNTTSNNDTESDESDDDDDDDDESDESDDCLDDIRPKHIVSNYDLNTKHKNVNIKALHDVDINGLKQRVKPKQNKQQRVNLKIKERINKNSNTITNRVYIYGTDLRHLCWWKRGLNVRFPYVQWMESGWSSTQHQYHIFNHNKKHSNDSDL